MNTPQALNDHCRCISKRYIPHPQSPTKEIEMSFITEPDLYRLIVASKLPSAQKFEREFVGLGIFIAGDRPVVSSRDIARVFEKRHDNVIRDIENLECSKSFSLLNFEESTYETERGKEYPEYLITRDGFTFLAMGFTGEKAMKWKIKYIEA